MAVAPASAVAKLKVVTTTSDLRSIVEAVGGDKVEVASLGTGREDPHFIDAKPSCMLLAHDADLWVRIGLELEIGYEGLILDGARNPKIRVGTPGHLDASEGVLRLEVPTGKIDRSMGDIHPLEIHLLEPAEYGSSPSISPRLEKLDPSNASYLRQRAAQGVQKRLDGVLVTAPRLRRTGELWATLLQGQLDDFAKQRQRAGWWGPASTSRDQDHCVSPQLVLLRPAQARRRRGTRASPASSRLPSHLSECCQSRPGRQISADGTVLPAARRFDWLTGRTSIKIDEVADSVGGDAGATDYIAMIDHVVKRYARRWKAPSK